ncbi:putative RNA-directed DNA polymerase [Tanacetum coccineum]
MSKLFSELGIIHKTSCAHTPQQNGIAERKHRDLLNDARNLMFQGVIPLKFWSDCVLTAVYFINRVPSSVLKGKSPYELVFKHKPSLSHLRCFLCLCFSTVLNNSDKFSFKSKKSVLIGYSSVKKAYKLLSLDSRNVFYSRDVKFYETMFPFKMKSKESVDAECASKIDHLRFFDNQTPQRPYDDGRATSVVDGSVPSSRHNYTYTTLCQEEYTATQIDDQSSSEGNNFQNTSGKTLNENIFKQEDVQTPGLRRFSRQSKLPANFNGYVVNLNVKHGIEKCVSYYGLNSVNMCLASTLIMSVEPTCYSNALKDPNWVDAMNSEIKALNRNKTWLHVNNDFLYGDLVEDVYMCLPQGYENVDKSKVCIFTKSLYGLKQASRQWNAKLTTNLVEHYFEHNDIVIIGNDESGIKEFKEFLSTKFLIKDLDFCYDNSLAIKKAANPMFHEKTKYFELDVHFVREKVMAGITKIVKVNTNVQVADIFTKCLGVVQHNLFCIKLGLLDMFARVMTGKEKGGFSIRRKFRPREDEKNIV